MLFYAGLINEVSALLSQKRGWDDATTCLWHCFGGFGFSALPLTIFATAGTIFNIIRSVKHKRVKPSYFLWAILTIAPITAIILLPQTPYPRIFIPIYPAWIFAAIYSSRPLWILLQVKTRQKTKHSIGLLLLIIFVAWGMLLSNNRKILSKTFTPTNQQDDLISPYYSKNNFNPNLMVSTINKIQKNNPSIRVYINSNADPLSLLFVSRIFALNDDIWLYKSPKTTADKIKKIIFPNLIIIRSPKDLTAIKTEFKLSGNFTLIKDCGFQKLYQHIQE